MERERGRFLEFSSLDEEPTRSMNVGKTLLIDPARGKGEPFKHLATTTRLSPPRLYPPLDFGTNMAPTLRPTRYLYLRGTPGSGSQSLFVCFLSFAPGHAHKDTTAEPILAHSIVRVARLIPNAFYFPHGSIPPGPIESTKRQIKEKSDLVDYVA